MSCGETLLLHNRDDDPARGGFGKLTSGEAPDDDLLVFDPGGILRGFAVEVHADSGRGGACTPCVSRKLLNATSASILCELIVE